jgi:hypothetical protein
MKNIPILLGSFQPWVIRGSRLEVLKERSSGAFVMPQSLPYPQILEGKSELLTHFPLSPNDPLFKVLEKRSPQPIRTRE